MRWHENITSTIIYSKILAQQSYSVNSSENKVCMYVCVVSAQLLHSADFQETNSGHE